MSEVKGHFVMSGDLQAVKDEVKELRDGLVGDVKNPGFLEMVRKTHDTVIALRGDFEAMHQEVEDLKNLKMKLAGAVVGAGLAGGGVGVGLGKLLGL